MSIIYHNEMHVQFCVAGCKTDVMGHAKKVKVEGDKVYLHYFKRQDTECLTKPTQYVLMILNLNELSVFSVR